MTAFAKTRQYDSDGQPYCSACRAFRPREEFADRTSRSGNVYPNGLCRTHSNARRTAYDRARAAQRRSERPKPPAPRTPKPYLLPPPKPIMTRVKEPTPSRAMDAVKRPAKAIVYPRIDPALCIYSGAVVLAESARCLISDLFAANVGMAIVKGWASTVSDDDEWAAPRFARPETAELWSAMVANRFGVREGRAA